MKVYIGSDHTGLAMKAAIIKHLKNKKIDVIDCGPNNENSVDYPDYGFKVANEVVKDKNNRGIVICGTGVGISIAANKVQGAIAGLVYESETSKLIRSHNNANILATGARMIAIEKAITLVDIFLEEEFQGDRHQQRIDKLLNK